MEKVVEKQGKTERIKNTKESQVTFTKKTGRETKKPAQKAPAVKKSLTTPSKLAKTSKKSSKGQPVKNAQQNLKSNTAVRKPATTRNVKKEAKSESDDDDLEVGFMSMDESRPNRSEQIFVDLTDIHQTSTPVDHKPFTSLRRSPRNSSLNQKPLDQKAKK